MDEKPLPVIDPASKGFDPFAVFPFVVTAIFFVLSVVLFVLWMRKEPGPQMIEPTPYVEVPALSEQEFEQLKRKLK
jgi:hypothetical protein